MRNKIVGLVLLLVLATAGILFLKMRPPENVKADAVRLETGAFHVVYAQASVSFKEKMDEATFEQTLKAASQVPEIRRSNGGFQIHYGPRLVLRYVSEGGAYRLTELERRGADGAVEDTVAVACKTQCETTGKALVKALLDRSDLDENLSVDTQYIQSLSTFVKTQLEGHYGFNSKSVLNAVTAVDDAHYEVSFDLEDTHGHVHKKAIKMLFKKEAPTAVIGLKIEGLCQMDDVLPAELKTALLEAAQKVYGAGGFQYLRTFVEDDEVFAKLVFKSGVKELTAIDYQVTPKGAYEKKAQNTCQLPVPRRALTPLETRPEHLASSEGEKWYKTVADEPNGIYLDHYYRLKGGVPYEIVVRVRSAEHKVLQTITVPYLYNLYVLI